MVFKDDQLIFRYFKCKKNYNKDFDKELIERFANIYELCNGDINKFILFLRILFAIFANIICLLLLFCI